MVKRIKIDEAIDRWNEKNPTKRAKTRRSLSEEVGCSFSQINNLQAGRVGKGIQTLNEISEKLNININLLIEK